MRTTLQYFLCLTLLTSLAGCSSSSGRHGRYLPVSSGNGVYLVDSQTGQMYHLPAQIRQGGEPNSNQPQKWKLAAEF